MGNNANPDVKIDAKANEAGLLEIRMGEAKKIFYPQNLKIDGLIDAPATYAIYNLQNQLINNYEALIVVDRNNLKITFTDNPKNEIKTVITGYLKINPELSHFCINLDKKWNITELLRFLKMRRKYFNDRDIHETFIDRLANYRATITTELEKKQDNQGSFRYVIDKTSKSELPNKFSLNMPIYEGQEEKLFEVEIMYDVRDINIDYWFESVELKELLISERDKIIFKELAQLIENDFCIIEV